MKSYSLSSMIFSSSQYSRYNMGAKCAEHCISLGYANKNTQLGYQTFLYGTENELRNVLMFLVDKLPKGNRCKLEYFLSEISCA